MIYIYKDGKTVSRSKNLRGILEYARKHKIRAISMATHSTAGATCQHATLRITFGDNAQTAADFADVNHIKQWLRSRKSWPRNYREW